MRLNDRSSACASVLTIKVLASPGTPTSRAWPRQKTAINNSSRTFSWPMIILPTSARICLCALRRDSSICTSDSGTTVTGLLMMRCPGGRDEEVTGWDGRVHDTQWKLQHKELRAKFAQNAQVGAIEGRLR